MFLERVLHLIEQEKILDVNELVKKSGLGREDIEFALDYWQKKGKLKHQQLGEIAEECCSKNSNGSFICKTCVYKK